MSYIIFVILNRKYIGSVTEGRKGFGNANANVIFCDSPVSKSYFDGEIGVAATLAPKGLGPQDPAKKWAHWVDLFGQPLS